jgi:hypothetical protein
VEYGTDGSPGVGVALATGQEVLSQLGGDGGPYGWTGRTFAGKELGEVEEVGHCDGTCRRGEDKEGSEMHSDDAGR